MTIAPHHHNRTAQRKTIAWDPKPARFFGFDRFTGSSPLGTYEMTVHYLEADAVQITVSSFHGGEPHQVDLVAEDPTVIEAAIRSAKQSCQQHLTWHLSHDSSWEEIPAELAF